MSEILYKELSYKIIGAAMDVHNKLGFCFLEKVYENALLIKFKEINIEAKPQYPIKVFFDEHIVGDYIADIFVENRIVIELKAVGKISDMHKAQLINYLTATNSKLGILINFGSTKLEYLRVINKKLAAKYSNKAE